MKLAIVERLHLPVVASTVVRVSFVGLDVFEVFSLNLVSFIACGGALRELVELVQLGSRDGLNGLHDSPFDALSARRCRE